MGRYFVIINNYTLGTRLNCLQDKVESIERIDRSHVKVKFKEINKNQKEYIEGMLNYKLKEII